MRGEAFIGYQVPYRIATATDEQQTKDVKCGGARPETHTKEI